MKRFALFIVSLFFTLSLAPLVQAAKVSPESIAGAETVNVAKTKALFDQGVLFVDVRSDKDWSAGRIPDAVHIELKKVFSEASLGKEVKKDEPVVFYCNGAGCMRSSKATAQAIGWGYSQVKYFRLGFPAWKAAGYPVE